MKKILSICLVLVLAMTTLVGCGEKKESGKTEDGKEVFLIGGIGPLTGAAASYGVSVKQGAEIAIAEINEAGGVKVGDVTYELRLSFEDDKADPENAIAAYNTLMDRNINALMGTVTSGAALAIIDSTYEDNILQITPSASHAGVTKNPNAFRVCFTDPLQGKMMAEFAVEELGLSKIAIIYNNEDDYSKGIMEAFVARVEEIDGEIVANESFVNDAVDFSSQLTKIKGTDAEIIFVPAYYQDAAYITTQAAQLDMDLPFIGADGWDGVLAQLTDASVAEGAIFLSPFLSTDTNASIVKFVNAYSEKYNATPDQFAAVGYDAVYAIAAAMEEAGSIENEDLIAAMTKINVKGLTGDLSFNEDGEPNKGAKFIVIEDGEYKAR